MPQKYIFWLGSQNKELSCLGKPRFKLEFYLSTGPRSLVLELGTKRADGKGVLWLILSPLLGM